MPIIEDKDQLDEDLIPWFQQCITAENHEEHVNDIQLFKEKFMAGIVPPTVFPDIGMPRSMYYYIMNHHNEHMRKLLEAVTNEDTLHLSTHDHWTLKTLEDFDDKSSENSELVAEDKINIEEN